MCGYLHVVLLMVAAMGSHAHKSGHGTCLGTDQAEESGGAAHEQKESMGKQWLGTPQVKFLFVRHAFSCANMVQEFFSGGNIMHNRLRDPMLTECGAMRSLKAGQNLSQSLSQSKQAPPDIVLSSSMLRAIETAAYMFPTQKITP